MESPYSIVRCQRMFKHPVARLFEAFLNPAILRNWYGPRDTTVGKLQVEPVIGGRFDVELLSERFGSLWARGSFREIVLHQRLVYTFIFDPDLTSAGDSVVTVSFAEAGDGTEVTVVQVLGKLIDPTGRTQGWTDLLEKLDLLLDQH